MRAVSPEKPPEISVAGPEQPGGRVAALDLGEVRTGVALSDPTRSLATPLEVVSSAELDERLRRLISEDDVREIVAGVPRTMAGETGFQAERALEEIRRLKDAFPQTSFVEWDERMTTRLASPPKPVAGERRRTNKSANKSANKKRGGKERVDHLAAARILQEYLDRSG